MAKQDVRLLPQLQAVRAARSAAALAGIVTRDPAMHKLLATLVKLGPSDLSVSLLGESGTGKEKLARALHLMSNRAAQPFVALNCAAIPEHLLESELFGHEKGAFTGAVQQKPGRVEAAQHGTLFLDEIGDMPSALQAKILRFLQERVIERVGGHTAIALDVRIVSATHQDLPAMIRQGRFRADLYYRLNDIAVAIPALRNRQGDANLLAHHFLVREGHRQCRPPMRLGQDALAAIEAYGWPGNVRELESCIKRAAVLCDSAVIGASDLGLPGWAEPEMPVDLKSVREAAEYRVMVMALARCDGNIVKAAQLLGVSRPTLYDLMHYHGVKA